MLLYTPKHRNLFFHTVLSVASIAYLYFIFHGLFSVLVGAYCLQTTHNVLKNCSENQPQNLQSTVYFHTSNVIALQIAFKNGVFLFYLETILIKNVASGNRV